MILQGLSQLLLVGGNSVEEDTKKFKDKGGNILICTPGRLEDLLTRKFDLNLPNAVKSLVSCKPSSLHMIIIIIIIIQHINVCLIILQEILILDEADRLLDLGFQKSLDTILSYLPRQRRTGLFSATQTKAVEDLIRAGLRNPVLVSVSAKAKESTPLLLKNYYIVTRNDGKLATLLSFIHEKHIRKAMLFLPTCACVDYWSSVFGKILPKQLKNELQVMAIHGKMKDKRNKILDSFRKCDNALLLCTDVMARGIDIPEVSD